MPSKTFSRHFERVLSWKILTILLIATIISFWKSKVKPPINNLIWCFFSIFTILKTFVLFNCYWASFVRNGKWISMKTPKFSHKLSAVWELGGNSRRFHAVLSFESIPLTTLFSVEYIYTTSQFWTSMSQWEHSRMVCNPESNWELSSTQDTFFNVWVIASSIPQP